MRAVDVIMKKRNGLALTREELSYMVNGYVSGEIPEYQISALLMAIYFNGMSFEETAVLTELMLKSGDVIHLDGIAGPFVDKHSTGGVGDKLSLILAPMVAACGVKVPMMSGRALGHTGGTLDKLESIKGYKTQLDEKKFRAIIQACGFAMTGQTETIVPADKKMYALRDVTATVESVPLITASILSKKVAEGAEALVFDVKSGPGAFMKTLEDAERLALSLVRTGKEMGKKIIGVITDMTEPLGRKVGNFFEVEESIDCLKGTGPEDVMEVTYRLGGWMLVAGEKVQTVEAGIALCKEAIQSGKAWELFVQNVELQGGDSKDMLEKYGKFRAPFVRELKAPQEGFIDSVDAFKIGLAGVYIGVGRNKTTDTVYPDVGFIFEKVKGDAVKQQDTIARVYAHSESALDAAWPLIEDALAIAALKPQKNKLIIKEITAL